KTSIFFQNRVRKDFGDYDIRRRLNEICKPTLIIVGKDDVTTPVDESKTIHKLKSLYPLDTILTH
ncbi:MAG: alpha/beta fold hydrolase, partial [Nitrosotalea sp.]